MRTLPVRLCKSNTLFFMVVMGAIFVALKTKGLVITWSGGIQVNQRLFLGAVLRVGVTMGAYAKILQYPRGNCLAWGAMSLLGLYRQCERSCLGG
ncbi:uncharacterized protein BCR38DRAFT_504820 [Pseudomassariella vexata]|uniref:Uncharacterized protein n=1 Tax=Pseudomassariella vexata TaxID=1141098 RepID=A0A1Y2DBC9_9PEZI|nr:uncharacterized protein BCR38DRAFT_504820 [Pseudomassariella vexata]ORY56570.1 hypothetical protein BCR38DRAFT_504820 [Pseudomassariella vexata]